MNKIKSTLIELLLLVAVSVTSLITLPWLKLDSTNLIKFWSLTIFGFISIAVILINKLKAFDKYLKYIFILFILFSTLTLFLSGGNITYQLFGKLGRNTGYISYLSLLSLLLISVMVSSKYLITKFIQITLIIGSASITVGYLQFFDLSPIKNISEFGKIVGFFSNTNFQSGFLGIIISILFPLIIKNLKKYWFVLVFIIFGLLQIYLAKSQQGFFVFISGVLIAVFILIKSQELKPLMYAYYTTSFSFLSLGVLGILNKGPLSKFIYEQSVAIRGDYWQAGWNMTLAHPFFGVGFDGYGDWYRRSRTMESIDRIDVNVTADAAHNVFLDISSSGGFPLLIIYISLVLYTTLCGWRVIKRMKGFDAPFAAIFAGWVAYQVQSLVSINQIGLAIWGWVLSGLVIGYEINTRESTDEVKEFKITKGVKVQALIGLVIGVLVASPPVVASYRMHSAFKSLDPNILRVATLTKPYEIKTMIDSAEIFRNNGYTEISLEIARTSVINFPDYFDAWYLLSLQANAAPEELSVAQLQMQRLNPLLYK
jgi:O-antigen ligase